MSKRLRTGKGIKVKSVHFDGLGEIVRSYRWDGSQEYEIRLGPAHFIYLRRKDFELTDFIIKYDTLVKLRATDI
jgi:hypothetical protein